MLALGLALQREERGLERGLERVWANVVSKKPPFGLLLLNKILDIGTSANAYMNATQAALVHKRHYLGSHARMSA
jgi:hypothetical protein